MKKPMLTKLVALASVALFAGITMFLTAPAVRISAPAEPQTKPAAVGTPEGAHASSPRKTLAVRVAEAPAGSVAPHMLPDDALERQRRATAAMLVSRQESVSQLYGAFFEAQGLPSDLQGKVASILVQPERALADDALTAMRAGTMPMPPSPETLRTQRAQQDHALRSLLGEAGFAAFADYRSTVPDRIILNGMKRQGAELTAEQSQLLLTILTEERKKMMGSAVAARNLDAMPKSQAMEFIQQDQARLQEAVSHRVGSALSPEQTAMLGDVFTRLTKPPNPR